MREQAEDLKAADNLDRAAADWERHGRGREWLIGGVRLAAAEDLANSPAFSERVRDAAEFLMASREYQDAQAKAELRIAQQRRDEAEAHAAALRKRANVLRVTLALTMVAALVAVAGLIFAEKSRREADKRSREAVAQQLTSQAQAILAGGQPGSALEAIIKVLAAQRISPTADTGAMLTALERTARLQRTVPAPGGRFLSADGSRIALRTESGIQMVATETGRAVSSVFAQPDDVIYGSSPDDRYLATGRGDDTIRVWDSVTARAVGQPIRESGHGAAVVAVSPDGLRVAADVGHGTTRLWDLTTGRLVGGPMPGRSGGTTLAFSPDGRRLASNDDHDDIRLWDADNGAALGEPLPGSGRGTITSFAFGPDSRTVAASEATILLKDPAPPLWLRNADTGAALGTPISANYGTILSIAFSQDQSRIVTGGSDKSVRLWDAHSGRPIGEPLYLDDQVSEVAFTRDGKRIVTASGDTVQIYDADPHRQLLTEMGGSKAFTSGAWRPARYDVLATSAGPRLLVLDNDALHLLDADNGEQVGQDITLGSTTDIHCDVDSDGRWLALWGASNEVRIFEISNGQPYGQPLTGHGGPVTAAQFSPDGQTLATSSDDNTIRLWDWRNSRQVGEPIHASEPIERIEFSGDGRHLVSLGSNGIRVWDTSTRETVGEPIRLGGNDPAVAVSPDYRRIAAPVSDTIQLWDTETGGAVGPQFKGHTIGVRSIAFGRNGSYFVSSGSDATVRFWDTASGRELGDPVDVAADLSFVAVSLDGSRVFVTAPGASPQEGEFTGFRITQLPAPEGWEAALCAKLADNPTEEQWHQWIPSHLGYMKIC